MLIDLGLRRLLELVLQQSAGAAKGHRKRILSVASSESNGNGAAPEKRDRTWTPAQRRKFKATMKKVWKAKKAAAKEVADKDA